MKQYPSITKVSEKYIGLPCIAQNKEDGSNLRVEWNRKTQKWYKWGTRKRLFNETDSEFGSAIEIFNKDYAEGLNRIFTDNPSYKKYESAVVFLEFFGSKSFAGQHIVDDPKTLMLFDINFYKHGFLEPRQFIKDFSSLKIPEIIYDGILSEEFINDIRESKYPVYEGVICKGISEGKLWMCKIKTFKYLEDLKKKCSDWQLFWEDY